MCLNSQLAEQAPSMAAGEATPRLFVKFFRSNRPVLDPLDTHFDRYVRQ